MKGYIYKIECTVNGRFYYGRTNSFNKRRSCHLHQLRKNIHVNRHLQNIYNKYGEDSLEFSIQCTVPLDELEELEQLVIDESYDNPLCMNISRSSIGPVAYGDKFSDEHKLKLSIAKKGKKRSDETKAKISIANTGRKRSDEAIAKHASTRQDMLSYIIRVTTDTDVQEFGSINEAARELGIHQSNLNAHLKANDSTKMHRGYYFEKVLKDCV